MFFFMLNMYKAFGLRNTNVIYNVLFTILLKSVDISGVPKRGTVVRPAAKQRNMPNPRNPPIPSVAQANPDPEIETVQTGRGTPTLAPPWCTCRLPQPQNPSQPRPRPGQGSPDPTKVPHSATDPTPADPSRDTRHIKVPHNSLIIARSNVESLAQLHGYLYV